MGKYQVDANLTSNEWQIKNKARDNYFIADIADKSGGPTPVEYLAGAVNSCISISAGMIAKVHHLDVKNFAVKNIVITEKLTHGMSDVASMKIRISFDSSMSEEEKDKFLQHTLRVSTVYQTLQKEVLMDVKLV